MVSMLGEGSLLTSASVASSRGGQLTRNVDLRSDSYSWVLAAVSLTVPAPWPAAGSTLTLLELLLGPPDSAFTGHFLFGVLDPADELVARQGCDVHPGVKGSRVGNQRTAQVPRKLVHDAAGHSLAGHEDTVALWDPVTHGSGMDTKIDSDVRFMYIRSGDTALSLSPRLGRPLGEKPNKRRNQHGDQARLPGV
jgi:hypothetical protein